MSDLISRQTVLDVLKQTGIIQDNDLGHLVVDEINRIPIAYDIEKVVAETEKQLSKLLHICALEDVDRVYNFYDSLEETIRKGGVE